MSQWVIPELAPSISTVSTVPFASLPLPSSSPLAVGLFSWAKSPYSLFWIPFSAPLPVIPAAFSRSLIGGLLLRRSNRHVLAVAAVLEGVGWPEVTVAPLPMLLGCERLDLGWDINF